MVDEWGRVECIDPMMPQDLNQRTVSIGLAVKAMILMGLGYVQRTLYLTPQLFRGKALDRLPGPGITMIFWAAHSTGLNTNGSCGGTFIRTSDFGCERVWIMNFRVISCFSWQKTGPLKTRKYTKKYHRDSICLPYRAHGLRLEVVFRLTGHPQSLSIIGVRLECLM